MSAGALWAVLMAGGSGTRFWPESRAGRPKQFLTIFGKKTLLEDTTARLKTVVPPGRIIAVTQKEQVPLVSKLLKLSRSQVIGENVGRNTAPCAVLAAALIHRRDPEAVLALLPADHRIGEEKKFQKALEAAAKVATEQRMPVTFGMKPLFPHTGYGYLEMDRFFTRKEDFSFYKLKCFHEKPSLPKARRFLKAKRYLWNSGMFVWRADALLEAAKKYLPEAYKLAQKILDVGLDSGMKRFYAAMPNISIDYGLMEKLAGKILSLPVDIDWHDLGGWQAFADLWPEDGNKNIVKGNALLVESSSNIVKAGGRLVALLGVKDLVVVDTPDALLICPKSETESIRKIVQAIKQKNLQKYL